MRKVISFSAILCIALFSLSIMNAAFYQEMQFKKRVAVLTFEDKTDHRYHWWSGQPVGEGMSDMLVTALVKSGRYSVIERQEIDKIMQEQSLAQTGVVTQESAAKVGQMLGVELAVFGAVTEFGWSEGNVGGALKQQGFGLGVKTTAATVAIDIRFVNTSTGEILGAESVRKQESKKGLSISTQKFDFDNREKFDESMVGKACRAAIDEVVALVDNNMEKIPWQCKIIKADAAIYINAGANSGIQVGQEFAVYRPGEELIDPDTGLSLGSEETKVGTIRVTNNSVASGKASTCEAVEGSGFQRNDRVRLQ